MSFKFSSTLPRKCRSDLNKLLYFNDGQSSVRAGIIKAISRFGQPLISLNEQGSLFVRVEKFHTQTIYAFSGLTNELVGVVVFVRSSKNQLSIAHLAVVPRYAHNGVCGKSYLTFTLLSEVRRIGHMIKGIEHVVVIYADADLDIMALDLNNR